MGEDLHGSVKEQHHTPYQEEASCEKRQLL
jgi:hypothetical protein